MNVSITFTARSQKVCSVASIMKLKCAFQIHNLIFECLCQHRHSKIAVYRKIITTVCIITFQCTGVSCQNRSVRSFNSMQGVTNPRCAIRRQNTGHAARGKKARSLMHAVISRSYPTPSVPVSWQIINAIIIHLLEGRNPQTSREFRLCTSTSHPCHLGACSRFLVVNPKQSK